MIVNGKGRACGSDLGSYLGNYLNSAKNEKVEVLEIRGSAFKGLTRSIESWEAEAQRSRAKKPLWHAQIAPAHEDGPLSHEQMLECVEILERNLGFEGQPRAVVMHRKKDGTEHMHVVWSRVDRETGKARRDSFTHRKNVVAAREMEERFDLRRVQSPEFDKTKSRAERREESKKGLTYKDWQKAKRSGLDPKERKEQITTLWRTCDTAAALRVGLADKGYILAYGDKRSYVIVDRTGDIHSLPRQIAGVNTEEVRTRLKDLDPASVPQVAHVQQQLRHAFLERQGVQPVRVRQAQEQASAEPPKVEGATPGSMPSRKEAQDRKSASLDPAEVLSSLTRQRSTFTQYELQGEITERLAMRSESVTPERIHEVEVHVRKDKNFISLGDDRTERPRYTSRDMLETELAMRDASDRLAERWEHGVGEKTRDSVPSVTALGEDQRTAYQHLMRAEGLSNVIGYAGSGKSTLMKSANEGWTAQGYRVRGAAIAGIAAEGLQKGSGIPSRTLASFLSILEHVGDHQAKLNELNEHIAGLSGRGDKARRYLADMVEKRDKMASRIDGMRLTSRDVVVVDEAGMVGSRDLNRLLQHADRAKAKVVLVGDAEQLQAIDAGGAFRALCDRHGAVKVSQIRRQEADWQQQATKAFGDGFTAEALDAYCKRGHVKHFEDHAAARDQVVKDWTASRGGNPDQTHLMLGFTNVDVTELNRQAREMYRAEGRLGPDAEVTTERGKRQFATGDRLYFLESSKPLDVKNGTLGTVERIEEHHTKAHHRMTVRLDDGRQVRFNTDEYTKFDHGFAATMHKSQGVTAARSFVLASRYMDRHAAYVAMSRQVKQVDMYYDREQFRDYDDLTRLLSRDRRKDTTLDYLRRAEEKGDGPSWLRRVTTAIVARVVSPEKKLEVPQRPVSLAERLQAINNQSAEERRAQRQAEQRLRDLLRQSPDKRSTGYSM